MGRIRHMTATSAWRTSVAVVYYLVCHMGYHGRRTARGTNESELICCVRASMAGVEGAASLGGASSASGSGLRARLRSGAGAVSRASRGDCDGARSACGSPGDSFASSWTSAAPPLGSSGSGPASAKSPSLPPGSSLRGRQGFRTRLAVAPYRARSSPMPWFVTLKKNSGG